ncbi:MAG TPA: DoxX family protein [Acidimicrobiia bacterium]|nr:DoxX family protein [Acidimicrobiia bacterium]
MDIALLTLRVLIGALLVGHGVQKLFGWFGGHGLNGTAGFFDSLGFRPGRRMAAVAGASEVGGGLLLAAGLFTPLAAAAVVGTLLVAASVHLDKGLWNTGGGYELPLVYALVGAFFALGGPGPVSLDHLVGLDDHWSIGVGAIAIAVGLLSGSVVIGRARRALARDAAPSTAPDAAGRTTAAA